MKRSLIAGLLGGVLAGPLVAVVQAEITPEQVRDAIDRGIKYLKTQQRVDGSWPEYLRQPGGVTALCTLALLSAGVSTDDECIQKALARLEKYTQPQMTYATALQTMVFCRANPRQYRPQIRRNVDWLVQTQIKSGANKGAWSYPDMSRGNGDNSNSQFALLALYEAELAGVAVEDRNTWAPAKVYWEEAQRLDGSWGYRKDTLDSTGSMTCAGIGALIIIGERFRQPNARAQGDQVFCCEKAEADNDRVERGLQWLARNFSVAVNPGQEGKLWLLYYLYGVERVGRMTNQRLIGQHDWYREGSEHLVQRQERLSGYWTGTGHIEDPLIGTSFALLFLSKGRRPVLLAKVQYSLTDDWNQHRSDVDNLTRFVESRWKCELTWQVIDLRAAGVEDLLQAPVLFWCGSLNPLPRSAAQRQELAQKLRDYLDRGGFLFVEGYCGGKGFDQGFRELMAQVFPADREPEYRLRLLEPEHPIWHAEQLIPPEQLRPLLGIEFGCRTSVVYAPPDPPEQPRPSLSCLWELWRSGRGQQFSPAVQAQIDAALGIGINVLAYATNRELKGKEEGFRPPAEKQPRQQSERGKLYVAKLRHPGGCNAAPRALVNLLEEAGRELKIHAQVREQLLNITDDALFDYHLVFMHGRNSFRLTEAERAQLKTYLERGGVLLADAICASTAFTESFRREMATIFPDRKLERIPPEDPLLSTTYGGFDLRTVMRRDPQPGGVPLHAPPRKVPPDLEGIKFDNRWGVIFSPFDLSCALERHESLECRGYSRDDAARIGLNVLLYSLQQ
jgi:hypothetical protein